MASDMKMRRGGADAHALTHIQVLRLTADHPNDRLRHFLGDLSMPEVEQLFVRATIDPEDLALLVSRQRTPRLRRLALVSSTLTPKRLAPLLDSPLLAGLTALDLTHSGLGDAGVAALVSSPACAGLTELALGVNELTDAALRALAASPHLGQLHRLSLGDALLEEPFAPPPDAPLTLAEPRQPSTDKRPKRAFHATPNTFSAQGLRSLGTSSHLTTLRELSLRAVTLDPEGIVELARSPLFPRLTTLDLGRVRVGAVGAAALIAALEARPEPLLDRIDLTLAEVPWHGLTVRAAVPAVGMWSTGLSVPEPLEDEAGDFFTALARLRSLERLELTHLLRGDQGPALCTALAGHERLRTLSLGLEAQHVPALLTALKACRLERLDLRMEKPGADAALKALRAWPGLASLQELGLTGEHLGGGINRLLESEELRSLRRLRLRGVGLRDRALLLLLDNPALEHLELLDLEDNTLTLQGVTDFVGGLHTRLPRLRSLHLFGNSLDWKEDPFYDWDGSVAHMNYLGSPEVCSVFNRLPGRVGLHRAPQPRPRPPY